MNFTNPGLPIMALYLQWKLATSASGVRGRPSAIRANTPLTSLGVFMARAKSGFRFHRREGSLDAISLPALLALELADDHIGGSSSFP
jgi:hypothetical protein